MAITKHSRKLEFFILDLDGVFTDGKFHYSKDGKIFKVFGADDHEALKMLQDVLEIHVVTADSRGFEISSKRIKGDMKLPLHLVSSRERPDWISERFPKDLTAYMGDGILDPHVFREVAYSIAPANSLRQTKRAADFVTKAIGGERAVAEACLHLLAKFFPKDYQSFVSMNPGRVK